MKKEAARLKEIKKAKRLLKKLTKQIRDHHISLARKKYEDEMSRAFKRLKIEPDVNYINMIAELMHKSLMRRDRPPLTAFKALSKIVKG